jgi:hypothetical protein
MSVFEDLLADPYAKREFFVEAEPWDGAAVTTLRFSSGGFTTEPTDSPANTYYEARVLQPYQLRRSMFAPGKIGGLAQLDWGEMIWDNTDGGLDYLRTYSFDARTIVVKMGGTLSNGTRLTFAQAGVVFNGTADGDAIVSDREVRLRLRDNLFKLATPIQTRSYSPQCLAFASDTDAVDASDSTLLDQIGSYTVEGWFFTADITTAGQRLVTKDDGGDGWGLSLFDGGSGKLTFYNRAFSTVSHYSTAVIKASTWHHFAGVYDHSDHKVRLYVDRVLVYTSGTLTGDPPGNKGWLLIGGSAQGGTYIRGRISSVSVWSKALSATEVADFMFARPGGAEASLCGLWRMDEGTGATAADSGPNGLNATITGATWETSAWAPESVAGTAMPLTYGEVLSLEPRAVDLARRIYQVHDRAVRKFQEVRDKELPLYPPFALTSTSISFAGMTITCGSSDDTSSLVPGQIVTLSGSVANNGDKTVATVSATSFTVTTSLTTGSAGPSVTIVTKAGTLGWTQDLTRGIFQLTANPVGKVTCCVRGDAGDSGYVNSTSTVARRIVTRHGGRTDPDGLGTDSFDALEVANRSAIGIYIDGTNPEATTLDTLSEVLDGAGCYHLITRATDLYQIGRFEGVPASPITAFDASTILGPFEVVPQGLPFWKVRVGWGHNYAVQGPQDLAGTVSAARYQFATEEWRYAEESDASVKEGNPNARVLTVLTKFVTQAVAQAEAVRLLAIWKVRHDMYKVPVKSAALSTEIGPAVTVTRSRLGLDAGADFVVLGFEEAAAPLRVSLEVWK